MTSAPEAHKTAGVLEWRCFHCDDVFKSEREARLHFGREDGAVPACQIKGSEGGLVEALRRAEDDAAEAWAAVHSETVDAVTAYHAQAARHREQIRALEQVGYDRGLADAKAHPEALGLMLSTPSVPAVAELSGDGLARRVAGAAESDRLRVAMALLGVRGFAFYDDPMEGGQDAYDISMQALEEADAVLAALSEEAAGTIAASRKPEEPTQEMIQAGLEALQTENVKDASLNGKVARIYGAMVSAAPEAS